jgi:hypothetical protein
MSPEQNSSLAGCSPSFIANFCRLNSIRPVFIQTHARYFNAKTTLKAIFWPSISRERRGQTNRSRVDTAVSVIGRRSARFFLHGRQSHTAWTCLVLPGIPLTVGQDCADQISRERCIAAVDRFVWRHVLTNITTAGSSCRP